MDPFTRMYRLHAARKYIKKKEIVDRRHALGMLIAKSNSLCLSYILKLAGVAGAAVNAWNKWTRHALRT